MRFNLLKPKYSILLFPFSTSAKAFNEPVPKSGLLLMSSTLMVLLALRNGLMAQKSSSVSLQALRKSTYNFFDVSTNLAQGLTSSSSFAFQSSPYWFTLYSSVKHGFQSMNKFKIGQLSALRYPMSLKKLLWVRPQFYNLRV